MRMRIPTGARAAERFGDRILYELPPRDGYSFLWINFKLMPLSGRPRRGWFRVFWLDWNLVEARLSGGRSGARLRAQEPALYASVEAFLARTYTRAWLIETGGVTEAEIDAEVARLAARRPAAGL